MTNDTKTHRDGAANPGLLQYELDARTLREKTERLKALRMARAATEPAAGAASSRTGKPATATAAKTPGKITGKVTGTRSTGSRGTKQAKGAKSSRSLSEWLSDQEALGRKP
ncbi:hypothetical protein [Blastochloris viridis]|uniref:Uncharacterized protein n=1 Tax=Blastochloris viridis TaxID=1079 RepID=A0A0H5BCX4_BLAVI|nr:hypothetical protein [Blastochloris viridis]ALK08571.1 hypothetical protein BVIR_777 [Blastochloris viridis]BAR98141.1 hypothetical protein BV133_548 [Blastochloris viridis]CUU41234.1 hypothetical protein BVIRIDIS_02220 [Blastochloris viridis]